MGFNESLLVRRRDEMNDRDVRMRFLGRRDWRVPKRIIRRMDESAELTKKNRTMTFTIAFNYGGRAEIVDAVRQIVEAGIKPDKIDEQHDPQVLVRPRDARPGSHDPHLGRVPHLELPAVGDRLQRARVHRRVVAGLPPRAPLRRRAGVPSAIADSAVSTRRDRSRAMSHLYRDTGVVLRTYRLGEADRIIVLFTERHGKVRAVAKGVRKTKSKFGSRLEPTSHIALQLYKGRELDIVTQAESIDHFRTIRDDLDRIAGASAMLEAVDQLAQDREPNPRLYQMLLGALRSLSTNHSPLVVPGFFLKALALEGFRPMVAQCVECGAREDLVAYRHRVRRRAVRQLSTGSSDLAGGAQVVAADVGRPVGCGAQRAGVTGDTRGDQPRHAIARTSHRTSVALGHHARPRLTAAVLTIRRVAEAARRRSASTPTAASS